jgi:hypothetical protein
VQFKTLSVAEGAGLNTSKHGGSAIEKPTYFGKSDYEDIDFPLKTWERAQFELAPVEQLFRQVAQDTGWRFVSNKEGRYPWPSRGVMLTRGLSRLAIRVTLNPLFLRDSRPFYILELLRQPRSNWLPIQRYSQEILAEYSSEELHDLAKMRAAIADALKRV